MISNPHVRQALAIWIALYPLLTLVLWVFQEHLARLPLPLRTFVLTVVLVPLLVFVAVPRTQRLLNALLPPPPPTPTPTPAPAPTPHTETPVQMGDDRH